MRKSVKRSILLLAAVTAASAFALPSTTMAASWGFPGTTHVLDASPISFNIDIAFISWSCAASQFHTQVNGSAALTVTGAKFIGCTGPPGDFNCTTTLTPTQLPWTVTANSTSDIRITNFAIHVKFENLPAGAGHCATNLTNINLVTTGTIGTGDPGQTTWDAAAHQITLTNALGLTSRGLNPISGFVTTTTGTLRDTTQTLTLS
jgi:hypothetical protein